MEHLTDEQTSPPTTSSSLPPSDQLTAAKATTHVDQLGTDGSDNNGAVTRARTDQEEAVIAIHQSDHTAAIEQSQPTPPRIDTINTLPPPTMTSPTLPLSSPTSPRSSLPPLKTHPADLVSHSRPDPHASLSRQDSFPCTPIRNSYEDLPSATQADDGDHSHGGNGSFGFGEDRIGEDEREYVGEEGEEEEEGEEGEKKRSSRRASTVESRNGTISENGATVGSHAHGGSEEGGEAGDAPSTSRVTNGLEAVGEEPPLSSSPPPLPSSERQPRSRDFALSGPPAPISLSNQADPIDRLPPSTPSKRLMMSDSNTSHSRSMSTPPPQSFSSSPSNQQTMPSIFSPASPPAMSPPTNSSVLPPPSNPPSRRPSSSQRPPTSSESSSANAAATSRPRERSSNSNSGKGGDEKERLSDSVVAGTTSTNQSSQSRSRRTLGEWQLTKTLGAGSMGKVKLGVSGISGEKVAIKIIPRFTSTAAAHRAPPPPSSTSDPASSTHSTSKGGKPVPVTPEPTASFLAKAAAKDQSKEVRTVREGSLCLLLHHPYVCGMREMMIYPHHYYFVQEYVNGGQMLDYIISHGRLRERSARKFARQIGSALEYCHANSIVHRDLKIENILISKTGNIKIIDFGLSNLYSPISHLSTFCGSLYFAAPELLNAKPYTGPEVDVWSFGIVLYVLVCGKVPFDDQSMPALHAKIKRGQVEYPTWLSAECKHLLSRMLVTVPSNRASLQEVLSHPWIVKGFNGAPAPHIPSRTPLRFGELDSEVLRGMTGFEFGTEAEIESNLSDVLQSELYRQAVRNWEIRKSKEAGGNSFAEGSDPEKERPSMRVDGKDIKRSPTNKRFSGLGFYGKKLAGGFNAAFAGTSAPPKGSEDLDGHVGSSGYLGGVGVGGTARPDQLDPTRGFHPLISIYYLVKEKIERERIWGPGVFASSTISLTGPPPPPAPAQAYQAGSTLTSPALVASPEIARPPVASPLIPMTPQPRQRATGDEYAPHPSTAPQIVRPPSSARPNVPTTNALPSSAPSSPIVNTFRPQSAYEPTSPSPRDRKPTNRMSLVLSPSERERLADSLPPSSSPVATPNSEDVPLSSSTSGGFARRFGSLLGRSSPESGKGHRSRASIGGMAHRGSNKTAASPLPQVSEASSGTPSSNLRPPVTRLPSSGSDVPLASPPDGKPVTRASTVGEISPSRHQRGVSMGATSLMRPEVVGTSANAGPGESSSVGRSGTGFFERRRQASLSSTTKPPSRPNTSNDITGMFDDVAEEELADSAVQNSSTGQKPANIDEYHPPDVGFIGRTPSRSSSGKETSDSAKPVWLKGLFSVSTTTTKPVATLRSDLVKVLDRLGVQHRDVKNGFECAHVPSIDLSSFGGGGGNGGSNGKDKNPRSGIKRRASKLLLSKKEGDATSHDAPEDSQSSLRIATDVGDRARTPSNSSFAAVSPSSHHPDNHSPPQQFQGGGSGGESNAPTSAISHDMIVRFEIFIVKMPLLPGFHGIQFRRMQGNSFTYQTLAKRILQELKL